MSIYFQHCLLHSLLIITFLKTMKLFCFFFFLSLIPLLTKCDLPIHVIMGDVYGTWKISQTKFLSDRPETCGGGIPNKNEENLNESLKHYKSYLNKTYGKLEDLKINLTLEKTKVINEWKPRDTWTFLAVRDVVTGEIIGHWTMVYDEGFEIRLKGRRYFGFFKYQKNHSGKCPQSFLDDETNIDKKCYSTDPTKIHLGWLLDEKQNVVLNEKVFHWGCFYAEKEDNVNIMSYVIHDPKNYHMYIENSAEFQDLSNTEKKQISVANKRATYEKVRFLETSQAFGSTKTNLREVYRRNTENHYACAKSNHSNMNIELNLPKNFTWGDPYNSADFENNVDDQGECGSCYAIASSFSLQKRFEIGFLKKYNKNIKMPKLSYHSLLSCSPFNQSCDGGYPFLIGRHVYEFGITTDSCMKNTASESTLEECKMDMGEFNKTNDDERNNSNRNLKKRKNEFCDEVYYASDYYYVGGCYECCNEYDMMNEIMLNGPIVVAINSKSDLLHFYNVDKNVIYKTVLKENKICDILNKGFNGWQYTNHAVNIVGWGEQVDENNNIIKYWIIRNTWGSNWGYKGYLKFQRGINLGGIESQAVYIDPDFTRGHAVKLLNKNV